MSDSPRVKAQIRRQLSMLLPINGAKSDEKPAATISNEVAREALMEQLERAGLRDTRK